MRQCSSCFIDFEPRTKRQVKCDECKTREKTRPKKRKRCAVRGCNNYVSLSSASAFCSSCYLSDKIIEKDLKRMKRLLSAESE